MSSWETLFVWLTVIGLAIGIPWWIWAWRRCPKGGRHDWQYVVPPVYGTSGRKKERCTKCGSETDPDWEGTTY